MTHATPSSPPDWHCLDLPATAAGLHSDLAHGLSGAAARARLAQDGPNVLPEPPPRSAVSILAAQFLDLMILVLLAAAGIAGVVGEPQDTVVILVIVLLNGMIGFWQEYRAERALVALKRLSSPHARVIRDGQAARVDAAELVAGDLVELEAGNLVPADLRLTEIAALRVDESALTGESQAVAKQVEPLPVPDLALGDRSNLAYKGTVVTQGRARGLVVATGMRSELGQIAALLAGEGGKTPLQRRLERLGRQLALAVLAICTVIFLAGWLRGEPALAMLLTAVSLAVAAIPEALPAVVTIALALGAARLVRQQALIRRLPAVETLGSVSYICCDKTGTLTLNRMRVDRLEAAGQSLDAWPATAESPWHELGLALALCNDARRNGQGQTIGDPTEAALLDCADAAGFEQAALATRLPRLSELPFDAVRARMSTLHRDGDGDGLLVLVKGAPEALLPLCTARLGRDGIEPLDPDTLHAQAQALAAQGLRVLACACRRLPGPATLPAPAELERELLFLGLVGLLDPPRPEAAAAVAACQAAGIVPVMITGDHPATARAIAMRLGLSAAHDPVLTGAELARLTPAQFDQAAGTVRVYARINPEQKIQIVQALQRQGAFVAMTGDGVNDAPALKVADIGIAMGRNGTDVAREAAHMTLLDDNFATIVAAVREGRRIFDNIRKFVRYALTGNAGEIWTIFLAPFLGLPIPLLPIHILWINLVTDGLPGLALASEPGERDLMRRRPRPPGESVFAHGLWQHILWVGLLIGAVCLATQAWAMRHAPGHWQSMVFTVLTLSQLGHAVAIRSERASLFARGTAANPALLGALLLTLALQLAVLYLEPLQRVFATVALTPAELALCLALSAVVPLGVEVEKALVRRGRLYRRP